MIQSLAHLIPVLLFVERLILLLLIVLGISTVSMFIWKWRLLSKQGNSNSIQNIKDRALKALSQGQTPQALAKDEQSLPGRVLKLFADNNALSSKAQAHVFSAQESAERRELDRGISFLGTVGSNAPFLGLTGTVIGILAAFDRFAASGGQGSTEVMVAIARALVATALGLLVAIPAVVCYNLLRNRMKDLFTQIREIQSLLMAQIVERESKGR